MTFHLRIFNGCEVLIENSVTRDNCSNSYPHDGIFNLHQTTIIDSFSYILFLWRLYLSLDMCFLINFMLK